jgi:NAD(P)-dependent dehydrogenase (short-subunit alcohol dehydrogenase family)
MNLEGTRILVAGATGELGSALARALSGAGADVGLAGRDAERLGALGDELAAPTARFEAGDPESCRTAVDALAAGLGGLDGIALCVGVAGFGHAGDVVPDDVRRLFDANALGPIELADAALRHIEGPGLLVAVSAVVARHPMAGLAHYSAAKGALAAYLAAVRRERRRSGLTVLDVQPPHMDTGFSERPLFGTAPALPEPLPAASMVQAIVDAVHHGRREVAWDPAARSLVTA